MINAQTAVIQTTASRKTRRLQRRALERQAALAQAPTAASSVNCDVLLEAFCETVMETSQQETHLLMENPLPDTEETVLPETQETSVQDTEETVLQETQETSVQDTEETVLPETQQTSVQDTEETVLPETQQTSAQDTEETVLQETQKAPLKDTLGTPLQDSQSQSVQREQTEANCLPTVHDSQKEAQTLMETVERYEIETNPPPINNRFNVVDADQSQVSREDLLKQIPLLRTQVKQHAKNLKDVDDVIERYKKENAGVLTKQMEKTREAVQKDFEAFKGKLTAAEEKVNSLPNKHDVDPPQDGGRVASKQRWSSSEAETDDFCPHVKKIKSLCEQEEVRAAALRKVETTEEEKCSASLQSLEKIKTLQDHAWGLQLEVHRLRNELHDEKRANKEAQDKVKSLEEQKVEATTVTDNNSHVMDAGGSQTSQEDLLKQIQLLKTQVKTQQEQYDTLQSFHQQYCDQQGERMSQTLKSHEGQLRARDNIINRLKKERTANYSRHEEKAREAEREEREALKTANACLKGMLNAAEQKNKDMCNWIKHYSGRRQDGDSPSRQERRDQEEGEAAEKNYAPPRDDLSKQVEQLKSALLEQKKITAAAQSEVEKLRSSTSVQDPEKIRNLHDKVHRLHMQVNRLKVELREEQKTYKEAESEIVRLKEERSDLLTEVDYLSTSLTTAFIEKADLEEERDRLHLQINTLKSEISEKTSADHEALSKVKSLEEEKAGQQAERDGLVLKVHNLESVLLEKTAALREAQRRVTSLEQERGDLRTSVETLKTALSKQQKDTEVTRSRLTEQEQEVREQKATARALEQDLKTMRDMFKTLVEKSDATFSALKAQKKKVLDLSREMERLRAVHREEVSALQSLEEGKRAALQREVQKLSDALKASQENKSALLTRNRELQDVLQETEKRRQKKKGWFRF